MRADRIANGRERPRDEAATLTRETSFTTNDGDHPTRKPNGNLAAFEGITLEATIVERASLLRKRVSEKRERRRYSEKKLESKRRRGDDVKHH